MISDRLGVIAADTEEIAGYLRGFTVGVGSYAAIVLAADGSYRDNFGSSDGLSSVLDRAWLRALRARADVIITSGATVRDEGLTQPAGNFLVATKSGDLTGLKPSEGRLLIASDVETHPSWPSRAEHLGRFASAVDVVREARTRWQNLQIEFGAPMLAELASVGLIDRLFVTAPTELAAVRRFGKCDRLFDISTLAVYAVAT